MKPEQLALVKQKLLSIANELWNGFDPCPPKELFHYTPRSSLVNIINSQELWCTDLRYVDDRQEGDHGKCIIQSVASCKSVYRSFKEMLNRDDGLFGLKHEWQSFICSFCSTEEQPQMWQDYADDGRGYALVFDYSKLWASCGDGRDYAIMRVMYDQDKQADIVRRYLDNAIHYERGLDISGHVDRSEYWFEVMFALLCSGVRFKAPGWCHQQEFRIYVTGSDRVRPFVAAEKERVAVPFDKAAVLRLVRGPAATDNIEEVRDIMLHNGFPEDVPIVQSRVIPQLHRLD